MNRFTIGYIAATRRKTMKKVLFILTLLIVLTGGAQSAFAEKCRITVTTEPQGAQFAVNLPALKFGPTPMAFEFERGKTYSITFTREGYKTKVLNYTADCKNLTVQLEREGSGGGTSVDTTKTALVSITSNVVNASVWVDGELKGKTPTTVKLNYGSHDIRVSFAGYGEYNETIQVNQPQMKVDALIKKGSTTNTASSGLLQVKSNVVNARVYIDNELKGKTPATVKLQYGTYDVRVSEDGFGDYSETVNLNRPEMTVTAMLSKSTRSSTVQINSNVKGAKVYIDDDYKGQVPVTLKLEYGMYNVRVTMDGYDDYEETVDIDSPSFKVMANLERWRSTRLMVQSNVKDADVYVDGKLVGNTPLNTEVDFGSHELQVSAEGYEDYWESFDAKSREMKITANLERAVEVSLTVFCNIAGADVFLNNAKIGKTPLVREQKSGTYKLRVSLSGSGYNDYVTTLRLGRNDEVVEAILTADNQLQVELPFDTKVRVDNIWYDVNWDRGDDKKQRTQVVTIYAPDKKKTQMHDLYIEYNGLEFSKQFRFYGAKEKVRVLKLGLALE